MKVRNGFVSNSSSSSYVLVIPNEFDVKKYFEFKNIKELEDLEVFDFDAVEENVETLDDVIETLSKDIKNGSTFEYDNYGYFQLFSSLFDDFILSSDDVGSDDGGITYLTQKEIMKKIENIQKKYK